MRILISTGVYPPAVGGPAYYASELKGALEMLGHRVVVRTYGKMERILPPVLRHIYFLCKTFGVVARAQYIVALDTFSVGFPTVCAAKILHKKIVVRIGGDFLWESYVERTRKEITLSQFYATEIPRLSLKEKMIFLMTRFVVENVDMCVFSTAWQRGLWQSVFGIPDSRSCVVENEYNISRSTTDHSARFKMFLWVGRNIFLKNVQRLSDVFNRITSQYPDVSLKIVSGVSQEKVWEEMKNAYALILPSFSDVSPNVVLQAVAYNLPCIVTQETGIRDRLGDIVLYIDPLDDRSIEKAVLSLMQKDVYDQIMKRMQTFSYVHTYTDIAEDFLNIYKKI